MASRGSTIDGPTFRQYYEDILVAAKRLTANANRVIELLDSDGQGGSDQR
jgi:hypothetical protein